MFNSHSAVKEVIHINHFTESNPTSPERQQAAYDSQFLILGSERHLLVFPQHWILHAEQTHKQHQQSNMDFHL